MTDVLAAVLKDASPGTLPPRARRQCAAARALPRAGPAPAAARHRRRAARAAGRDGRARAPRRRRGPAPEHWRALLVGSLLVLAGLAGGTALVVAAGAFRDPHPPALHADAAGNRRAHRERAPVPGRTSHPLFALVRAPPARPRPRPVRQPSDRRHGRRRAPVRLRRRQVDRLHPAGQVAADRAGGRRPERDLRRPRGHAGRDVGAARRDPLQPGVDERGPVARRRRRGPACRADEAGPGEGRDRPLLGRLPARRPRRAVHDLRWTRPRRLEGGAGRSREPPLRGPLRRGRAGLPGLRARPLLPGRRLPRGPVRRRAPARERTRDDRAAPGSSPQPGGQRGELPHVRPRRAPGLRGRRIDPRSAAVAARVGVARWAPAGAAFRGLPLRPEPVPGPTRAAVTRVDHGEQQVYAYNLERATSEQLTRDGQNWDPAWHPDGRRLAVTTQIKGNFDVRRLPADGSSPPEALLATNVDETSWRWAPDGASAVFKVYSPLSGKDVWRAKGDGSAPARCSLQRPRRRTRASRATATGSRFAPGARSTSPATPRSASEC